ncbi:MAG: TlyA family RNA methyltransferase [Oscillospiraceae bacterium]
MRLDIYLTEKSLCKSRTAAQALIKSGGVSVDGKPCTKPSAEVDDAHRVEITGEQLRYVGRGGLKLEAAVEHFSIDLAGAECIDIGASTGGFTDCMLQHGAAKVYAVDVGTDQLADTLRADPRVISLEKTDIRTAELPQADFIGTDVSFISLKLILPHIHRLLKSGGSAVALIKPQFEAGKSALNKNGIVRDERVRLKIRDEIAQFAADCGFEVAGCEQSPITGGDGNVEYLMYIRKS